MPHLNPAIRKRGRAPVVGQRDDSHITIRERNGLSGGEEGFIPSNAPKMWLSRQSALGWMRQFEPDTYGKLRTKVPPEGLHSHIYAAAKGIVQRLNKEQRTPAPEAEPVPAAEQQPATVDLSDKTAIVYDRGGLYLYCAEKLAEKYKTVFYYLADSDAYPTSQKATIGMGLPGIKRIHDFWKHLDEADIVYFWDCYDGELQHWLRSKGYKVFGSGRGEQVEIDKIRFLELLDELKLPKAETYIAKGLTDLHDYLEKHDGQTLYLKNLHRGDFESRKFTSIAQSRPFLDDLRKRLGSASDTLDVLVQHKIDADCEAGYDGYCVDGEFTGNCIVGYELKDKGLVAKIFEEPPEVVKSINDAFGPTLKKLGYNGNYSTEIRITKDGKPYYIDPTCRVPSPPGELMCEMYENWAEVTYQVACGQLPILEPKAVYGTEIILTSDWHNHHELHVAFPKAIRQHVKLKNHTLRDGEYYCIPNGNGGFFGAVVAWADTLDEAIEMVLSYAKQIEADELEYDEGLFDDAKKQIEAGERHGIVY
jgi:hypothetical protein